MNTQSKDKSHCVTKSHLVLAPRVKGYDWTELQIEGTLTWNRKVESLGIVNGRKLPPKLLGVFVDLTPSCNLNCWFCYSPREVLRSDGIPKLGLSLDELKSVVDTSKSFGIQSIVTAGRGEPFLDPNIMQFARHITEQGLWFVVFTNNMHLTPEIARELYSLNVSVIAKLGSLNPAMQDYLVGKPGAHEAIYRGLNYLLDAGFEAPRLAVDATIYRETTGDLVDVFRYCRSHNLIPYFEALIERGNVLGHPWMLARAKLTSAELTSFFELLRDIDEKEFGYTWEITSGMHSLGYGDCKKNSVMVSVRENGDVNTCVNERDTSIGNIRDTPFAEIITESPELASIRKIGAECCSTTCGSSHG